MARLLIDNMEIVINDLTDLINYYLGKKDFPCRVENTGYLPRF